MTKVNPVQATTYYLNSANNPITFGTGTGIDVSSGSGIGVYGSNVQGWAATNQGTISGNLYGIDLTAGGSVTNKAGATISGGHANVIKGVYGYNYYYSYGGGVKIAGGAGTVTNAGAINSPGLYGVELTAGGSVTNEAGAKIISSAVYSSIAGIEIAGGTGTVTNGGDISGFSRGVELQAGGSVTNRDGGTISGSFEAVVLGAGGSVTNEAGATISGIRGITAVGGAAAVINAGTIMGGEGSQGGSQGGGFGGGVYLYAGGSITNKAGAIISADYGVFTFQDAATVTNAGDITGGNHGFDVGVRLAAGGLVTNQAGGTISGNAFGVIAADSAATVNAGDISGSGGVLAAGSGATVTNSGAIAGTKAGSAFFFGPIPLGDGVLMHNGGTVTNKAGGTITGVEDGVYVTGGAGSVTNAGTISGTTASVQFAGAGADTLTLETGSALIGDAIGSTAAGATNALVLEGAGIANNNFENFNTLTVQTGGDWTLGGTSSFAGAKISSGALLDDAGALTLTGTSALAGSKTIISSGDTLTLNGTTALSGKVDGAGTLALTGGARR